MSRGCALLAAPAVGLLVGVVLTVAHGLLPERWAVLAGTSALWGLAPMMVGRGAAAWRVGVTPAGGSVAGGSVAGVLTMAGTLLPWLVVHAGSTADTEIMLWLIAGAVAGGVCGAAGALSVGDSTRSAIAAGAVPGMVAGEAVYGLVMIGGPAWALELLIAAGLLAAVSRSGWRLTASASAVAFLMLISAACVGYDAVLS